MELVPGLFALLGVLAVLAVVVWSVLPLLHAERWRRGRLDEATALAEEDRLLDEREATYRALAELDFDRQLGNLDEADYRALRERYRHRAVAVLRALDGHEPELDAQIERAVTLQRAARRSEGSQTVLAQRAATGPRFPRPIGGRSLPDRPATSTLRRQAWLAIGLSAATAVALVAVVLYVVLGRGEGAQQPLATLDVAVPTGLAASGGLDPFLFLGAGDGLLMSGDAGRSFTPVPDVQGSVLALLGSADGKQPFVAATATTIYTSTDGSRWTRSGAAPGSNVAALARSADDRPVLYAAGADGHIFASGDNGATWKPLGPAPAPVTALAVLPGPPDLLLIGTNGGGVLASADQGATWSAANGFASGLLESTRIHALFYDPNSGDTASTPDGRHFSGMLYVGTDLGLSRSPDAGGSWIRLPFRGDVRVLGGGVGAPAPLYLLDVKGRLYRSLDKGMTW